jgi:ribosomal protein L29
MKAKEIKKLEQAELVKILGDKRTELRTHRFAAVGGRSKNVKAAKAMRKTIARTLTELRSRAK